MQQRITSGLTENFTQILPDSNLQGFLWIYCILIPLDQYHFFKYPGCLSQTFWGLSFASFNV